MFGRSNTPDAVRPEDQPLIKALNDACRQYGFSAAAAEQLLDIFTNPEPRLRQLIFELFDPSPRANPFVTSDYLAAFTHEVWTRSGEECSARWGDLTTRERRLARRIERFAQDKTRVRMRAGPPQNVNRALILYVIRLIEERTGVQFRFWQHRRPTAFDEDEPPPPLNSSGGPMLRLAEAALHQLFQTFDSAAGYLGLVSPSRHYKRDEIARTAKLARRASKASPTSPAKWPSDLILAHRGEVRIELAGKIRQKTKDRGSASLSSWDIAELRALVANPWFDLREGPKAAVASERQTPSGLDVLQANLKSGAQPDLIELGKGKMPRDSQ